MILSILIPTLVNRSAYLGELLSEIEKQRNELGLRESVQIITDSRGVDITTGEKRNSLLQNAEGKYVWFIDDDDELLPGAMRNVIAAMLTNADVIGIDGYMTTDGQSRTDFEIRIGHPYEAQQRNGKEIYLRCPNHITPMKRELAIQVPFPHKTLAEDYEWCMKLRESGLLKTQTVAPGFTYHYKYRSKK